MVAAITLRPRGFDETTAADTLKLVLRQNRSRQSESAVWKFLSDLRPEERHPILLFKPTLALRRRPVKAPLLMAEQQNR